MSLSPKQVSQLLKTRQSTFPSTYIDKPIPKEIIEDILENANWAPNHKQTEPWRFKVITGKKLVILGETMSDWYKANTPEDKFSPIKYKKLRHNPAKAACIIAVCMQRDPEESLPEWEEMAAVACAVQNMYLSCTAHNIGCFWSTPKPALNIGAFLDLEEGENCLGLFYMGYHNTPLVERSRGNVKDKTVWL